MDRFEDTVVNSPVLYIIIYIPVWIDLKLTLIDDYDKIVYLHSSMDRFEGEAVECWVSADFNLHSSMDRFEVAWWWIKRKSYQNLHSSMDRFKDSFFDKTII